MFSPFYNGDYSYDQPIDFESLFDLLHQHQFYYKENTRPRVIKKLETEDEFQIQIYKPYGNYNNYEVNVIKSNPPIVKVVISSIQDNFKTILPFNVNYIDIDNINWQWYKQQNVLVLNIPKRIHYVHLNVQDILNCLLGCNDVETAQHDKPTTDALKTPNQKPQTKKNIQGKANASQKKEEFAKVKKETAAQKKASEDFGDANLKDSIEEHEHLIEQAANALKSATETSSKQDLNAKANALSAGAQAAAEAKHKEELERTKQELEAQKKAAHDKIVKAQQELEEIAKKEAEAVKLHEAAKQKELEEQKRKAESEEQKAKEKENLEQKQYDEFVKQQQEFLKQFFGFNLGPAIPTKDGANAFYTAAKLAKKQKPKVAPKPKQLQTQPAKQAKDEEESIPSEPETEPESSKSHNSNENLHKHPSLEEVEDEESVMFRKRFGH